ncbi:MAG: hypothetical protein O6922_08570 [Chloroflexi bacterium]|nr:hypothetical protein [Chloroflexota bacterium]
MTIWKLSWRLAREQGPLLVIAVSTTVIAAAIAVGITLYLGGIETATLEHEFSRHTGAQVNGWVNVRNVPFNSAAFDSIAGQIQAATSELGDIGTENGTVVRSAPFSISVVDDDQFLPFSNVHMQVMPGGSSHLHFEPGSAPAAGSSGIAIPLHVAQMTGATVGTRLTLQAPGQRGLFDLVVTGVYEPIDTSDAYWTGISDDLLLPDTAGTGGGTAFVGLVDESLLFSAAPGISSTVGAGWWLISIDTLAIMEAGLGASLDRVNSFTLAADAVAPDGRAFVGAEAPLRKLSRDRSAQMVPVAISAVLLLLVAGQVVLLAGSVMTSSARSSIRRLGLRGGGPINLLGFSSLSAVIVFVIPTLLGPPLAWLIVPLLGTVGALEPLTGGSNLHIAPDASDFGISAAAGLVSAVVILLPGIGLVALRRLPEAFRDRAAAPPLLWRLKLDLLIVAISLIVIWEMDARGLLSPVAGRGGPDTGLIMASTGFVAVAAVLALVRAWPVVPGLLGARAVGRASSAAWYAVTSVRRSSFRHAWLLTLVAIATVTVVADSTIAASLEADGLFAASQATGSGARIAGLNGYRGESNAVIQRLAAGPAIDESTPALRTTAALGANGEGARFELLAVDPNTLAPMLIDASMRQSAAEAGGMLPGVADGPRSQNIPLPANTESLRLVGRISEEFIDIWVRVKGADGATTTVLMSTPESPEPTDGDKGSESRVFAGSIGNPENGPYELISVLVYEPPVGPVGHAVTLLIERLEAVSSSGSVTVISGLDDGDQWSVLPGVSGIDGSVVEPAGVPAPALTVDFGPGTDGGIRGVHIRDDLNYLPMAVSTVFEENSDLREGDIGFITAFGKVVPVRIAGTVDAFATLDSGSSFAIIDYRTAIDYLSLTTDPVLPGLAELFVSVQPGSAPGIRSFVKGVAGADVRVFVYEQLVDESTASAGASAGWKGMHIVVISALTVLTVTGLALFIGHDFVETRRSSNILSALGVSRFGEATEKVLRTGMVSLIGVGAGLVLGGLLGAFVATRITDAYSTELTESAQRAASIDLVAGTYIAALVIAGLLGMFGFVLLRGERQPVDRRDGLE